MDPHYFPHPDPSLQHGQIQQSYYGHLQQPLPLQLHQQSTLQQQRYPSQGGRTGYLTDSLLLRHKSKKAAHESPKRLSQLNQRIKQTGLLSSCVQIPVRRARDEEILTTHTLKHLRLLKSLETRAYPPGQPFCYLDDYEDTYACVDSTNVVLSASGGTVDLGVKIANGELKNGFAAIRPPGHHCGREGPQGFCLVNNVAIAANNIRVKCPHIKRVLIVDWDVHHGNGTEEIFLNDPDVLFYSMHRREVGFFPESGDSYSVGGPVDAGDRDKIKDIIQSTTRLGIPHEDEQTKMQLENTAAATHAYQLQENAKQQALLAQQTTTTPHEQKSGPNATGQDPNQPTDTAISVANNNQSNSNPVSDSPNVTKMDEDDIIIPHPLSPKLHHDGEEPSVIPLSPQGRVGGIASPSLHSHSSIASPNMSIRKSISAAAMNNESDDDDDDDSDDHDDDDDDSDDDEDESTDFETSEMSDTDKDVTIAGNLPVGSKKKASGNGKKSKKGKKGKKSKNGTLPIDTSIPQLLPLSPSNARSSIYHGLSSGPLSSRSSISTNNAGEDDSEAEESELDDESNTEFDDETSVAEGGARAKRAQKSQKMIPMVGIQEESDSTPAKPAISQNDDGIIHPSSGSPSQARTPSTYTASTKTNATTTTNPNSNTSTTENSTNTFSNPTPQELTAQQLQAQIATSTAIQLQHNEGVELGAQPLPPLSAAQLAARREGPKSEFISAGYSSSGESDIVGGNPISRPDIEDPLQRAQAELANPLARGRTINVPLPTRLGDYDYLNIIKATLLPLALEFQPDLIIVSAGFDPSPNDPLGNECVTAAGFYAFTRLLMSINPKVMICLEGGYFPLDVAHCGEACLRALLDMPFCDDLTDEDRIRRENLIPTCKSHLASLAKCIPELDAWLQSPFSTDALTTPFDDHIKFPMLLPHHYLDAQFDQNGKLIRDLATIELYGEQKPVLEGLRRSKRSLDEFTIEMLDGMRQTQTDIVSYQSQQYKLFVEQKQVHQQLIDYIEEIYGPKQISTKEDGKLTSSNMNDADNNSNDTSTKKTSLLHLHPIITNGAFQFPQSLDIANASADVLHKLHFFNEKYTHLHTDRLQIKEQISRLQMQLDYFNQFDTDIPSRTASILSMLEAVTDTLICQQPFWNCLTNPVGFKMLLRFLGETYVNCAAEPSVRYYKPPPSPSAGYDDGYGTRSRARETNSYGYQAPVPKKNDKKNKNKRTTAQNNPSMNAQHPMAMQNYPQSHPNQVMFSPNMYAHHAMPQQWTNGYNPSFGIQQYKSSKTHQLSPQEEQMLKRQHLLSQMHHYQRLQESYHYNVPNDGYNVSIDSLTLDRLMLLTSFDHSQGQHLDSSNLEELLGSELANKINQHTIIPQITIKHQNSLVEFEQKRAQVISENAHNPIAKHNALLQLAPNQPQFKHFLPPIEQRPVSRTDIGWGIYNHLMNNNFDQILSAVQTPQLRHLPKMQQTQPSILINAVDNIYTMRLSKLHDILIDPYSLHLTPLPQSYINIVLTQYGTDRQALFDQQSELRQKRIELLTSQQSAKPYPFKVLTRLANHSDPNIVAQYETTNPDLLSAYEQFYLNAKRTSQQQPTPFARSFSHPDPCVDVIGLLLNGTKLALSDSSSTSLLDLSNPYQPSSGAFGINEFNKLNNNSRTNLSLLGINGIPITDYVGALYQELNHINLALPINGKALELHAELSIFLQLLITLQQEITKAQANLQSTSTHREQLEAKLKAFDVNPNGFQLTIATEHQQTDPITQLPTTVTVMTSPYQQTFDELNAVKVQYDREQTLITDYQTTMFYINQLYHRQVATIRSQQYTLLQSQLYTSMLRQELVDTTRRGLLKSLYQYERQQETQAKNKFLLTLQPKLLTLHEKGKIDALSAHKRKISQQAAPTRQIQKEESDGTFHSLQVRSQLDERLFQLSHKQRMEFLSSAPNISTEDLMMGTISTTEKPLSLTTSHIDAVHKNPTSRTFANHHHGIDTSDNGDDDDDEFHSTYSQIKQAKKVSFADTTIYGPHQPRQTSTYSLMQELEQDIVQLPPAPRISYFKHFKMRHPLPLHIEKHIQVDDIIAHDDLVEFLRPSQETIPTYSSVPLSRKAVLTPFRTIFSMFSHNSILDLQHWLHIYSSFTRQAKTSVNSKNFFESCSNASSTNNSINILETPAITSATHDPSYPFATVHTTTNGVPLITNYIYSTSPLPLVMDSQFVDLIIKPIKQNGLSYLLSQFINSTLFPQSKLNELWLSLLNFINVVQTTTNDDLIKLYNEHGIGNNPTLFELLPSPIQSPLHSDPSSDSDAQNPLTKHRIALDKKYSAEKASLGDSTQNIVPQTKNYPSLTQHDLKQLHDKTIGYWLFVPLIGHSNVSLDDLCSALSDLEQNEIPESWFEAIIDLSTGEYHRQFIEKALPIFLERKRKRAEQRERDRAAIRQHQLELEQERIRQIELQRNQEDEALLVQLAREQESSAQLQAQQTQQQAQYLSEPAQKDYPVLKNIFIQSQLPDGSTFASIGDLQPYFQLYCQNHSIPVPSLTGLTLPTNSQQFLQLAQMCLDYETVRTHLFHFLQLRDQLEQLCPSYLHLINAQKTNSLTPEESNTFTARFDLLSQFIAHYPTYQPHLDGASQQIAQIYQQLDILQQQHQQHQQNQQNQSATQFSLDDYQMQQQQQHQQQMQYDQSQFQLQDQTMQQQPLPDQFQSP